MKPKSRRDYHQKSFRNPYYLPKAKAKKNKSRKFGLVLIILVFIFCLYLLFGKPLKITAVQVVGNQTITQSEIQTVVYDQMAENRWLIFSQKNILFFSTEQTKKNLMEKYLLDDLKIKKKYFNEVVVTVKEKQAYLIWSTGDEKYSLDLSGMAIKKIEDSDLVIVQSGSNEIVKTESNQSGYPIIYDQSCSDVQIGNLVANKKLIDFIINLTEQIELNTDLSISHYNLVNPLANDIALVTAGGWEARFSLDQPIKSQIDLLIVVLQKQVKDQSKLQYIDLRFGDKVFYQ
ncbi:MAG: hypothetical protein WCW26_00170 [Candidatus Buchananbacteria bacterium]